MEQNGLQHIRIVQNLLIPLDFEWMLENTNFENTWMTLADFFNAENNEDPWGPHAFRLGLDLYKTAGDNFFHFAIEGDVRGLNAAGQPAWVESFEPIESAITIGIDDDNNTFDIQLGEWMGFVLTVVEGGPGNGHVTLELIQDGTTHVAIDEPTHTVDPDPMNTVRDGFHYFHPIKLYTSDDIINGFNANQASCQIFAQGPCILRQEVNDFNTPCAAINKGNRDAAEDPSNGNVTLGDPNNQALRLGEEHVGLIFYGYDIPAGSTIESATVEFTRRGSGDQSGTVNINIRGSVLEEDFTTTNGSLSDRFNTGFGDVNLNDEPVNWEFSNVWLENQPYESEDISGIIQAIIDDTDPNNLGNDGISPDEGINLIFKVNIDTGNKTHCQGF